MERPTRDGKQGEEKDKDDDEDEDEDDGAHGVHGADDDDEDEGEDEDEDEDEDENEDEEDDNDYEDEDEGGSVVAGDAADEGEEKEGGGGWAVRVGRISPEDALRLQTMSVKKVRCCPPRPSIGEAPCAGEQS
jgi:hypothetical protein